MAAISERTVIPISTRLGLVTICCQSKWINTILCDVITNRYIHRSTSMQCIIFDIFNLYKLVCLERTGRKTDHHYDWCHIGHGRCCRLRPSFRSAMISYHSSISSYSQKDKNVYKSHVANKIFCKKCTISDVQHLSFPGKS